jgi:hypothetical protein
MSHLLGPVRYNPAAVLMLQLPRLEGIVHNICYLRYPFALDIDFLVMFFDGIKVRCAEQAKTNAGFLIIE